MDKRTDRTAIIYARLSRYWVARLRREKMLEAIEHAVTFGVLERMEHEDGLSLFRRGPKISGWTPERVPMLIRHAFGARSPGAVPGGRSNAAASLSDWEFPADDAGFDDDVWEVPLEGRSLRKVDGGKGSLIDATTRKVKGSAAVATTAAAGEIAAVAGRARSARKMRPEPLERMSLLRLVRDQASPPSATQVATLLLLADAAARAGHDLTDMLSILRRPKPIVAITGTVAGFEAAFLDLLKRGFVLPGRSNLTSGYDLRSINDYRHPNSTTRNLILFRGREIDEDGDMVDQQVSRAVQNIYPILAVADDADLLPAVLIDAADLNLVCNPVTPGLIIQIMQVVLGDGEWLAAIHNDASSLDGCDLLTLADLGLTIRPGMSPERCMTLLRSLIATARKAQDGNEDGSASRTGKTASSSSDSVSSRRGKIGTGSTLIEPEPIGEENNTITAPLRVETLTGYGEATHWALMLKTDLELWKKGSLDWSQMSTRLLLAGPPGTGKTIFARALANTLQVRLLATSVGTWLEPSHLGDVLARMAAAFAEAESYAPCILFIDEIDGIGRRGSGNRDYDDYWISVVNRALELMDGAMKSQGVIILGATNNPEVIDKALLRSGRLETRIDIPLPDVDALVSILRHHLQDDLAAIVESAPGPRNEAEKPDAGGPQQSPEGEGRPEPPETAQSPRHQATTTTIDRAELYLFPGQSIRHATGGNNPW